MTSDVVHLSAAGVSLVLATAGPGLPRVIHWGAALGDLDRAQLEALVLAATAPRVGGELDDRQPVSVLPEHARGWMHTPGLAGSRGGRDHSAAFTVTGVEVSGADVSPGGTGVQRVVVTAADAGAQVEVRVTFEMLGSGLVRARAAVTPTGPGSAPGVPFQVEHLNVFMPVPREATEVLDYTGRWIRERTPQRLPFSQGAHVRESRRGKPGHDAAFLIAAGTAGFGFRRGEVWLTHVGWSGNSRTIAERANDGTGLIGGGELPYPGEISLSPGEAYEGPWVYFAYSASGLDAASARIHRWLRSLPRHPRTPRPIIVNTWEAAYFDHRDQTLRALADAAADVGAERFVLDDGWFRHRRSDNAGLGDWYVDEGVYPDGLAPLAEYVRSLGLEFGLWVEPEMVNPDSDLARAHPEWIAQPGGGRLPREARSQQVLDLTHPDAYAYIEERLHTLVGELRPAYLKWDHNRDLLEAGSAVTGRPIGHGQTLAFYALVDGLKAAYPGLEIESCAGGGGRIDLGALERVDRVWTSDTNDPLERQRLHLHTSLLVPPEMMGAHIGPPRAHTTHRIASLDFRAGTAMWGHLGLEWNLAGPDASQPETRARLREWLQLHKRFRALLHTGDVVRSDLPAGGRVLHGVVATSGAEALFSFAATDSVAETPTGALRLPGLDAGRTYTVRPVGPVELDSAGSRAAPPWWLAAVAGTPVALSGTVLGEVGLQAPSLMPDEVVLIHLEAV